MGARVDLHLRQPNGTVLSTTALLNGGFEAADPHVLLPRRAYQHLFPQDPVGVYEEQVQTAGGTDTVAVVPGAVEAWVHGGDRSSVVVGVKVLVSDAESEVLVSDTAIDAFGIEIKSHGQGLWRFNDEERVRPSVPHQLW